MVKPGTIFKRTANWLLDLIAADYRLEDILPGEEQLAVAGDVSRTTMRTALGHLEQRGILERQTRVRIVKRRPTSADYFELSELVNRSDQIQSVFMEQIFHGHFKPGHSFSESALAREAAASTAIVREFLIGFSRFGLIEKKPRGGWRLRAFDAAYARELADMRDMLELQAIDKMHLIPSTASFWSECRQITERHLQLKSNVHDLASTFRFLDREFHQSIIGSMSNRFALDFYDVISFIYHYHYQWAKRDERHHSVAALDEHLLILDALERHHFDRARDGMRRHLLTARNNLLQSIDDQDHRASDENAPPPNRQRQN